MPETSTIKEEARRLDEQLPDDATWEDLMYEIYVRQSIEEGRRQARRGIKAHGRNSVGLGWGTTVVDHASTSCASAARAVSEVPRCPRMVAPPHSPPMHMTSLDWTIVVLSIVVSFIPALLLAKRAGRSTSEFFTSGRSAPWWLIGVSMVATTFSTDTPNLVTNLVREKGVANNWAWWSFLLTGMATVFFYARLWRRSKVLTDLEFYEIRYSGKPTRFVRGVRAVDLGLFF